MTRTIFNAVTVTAKRIFFNCPEEVVLETEVCQVQKSIFVPKAYILRIPELRKKNRILSRKYS